MKKQKEQKDRLKIIPVNPSSKGEFGVEVQNGGNYQDWPLLHVPAGPQKEVRWKIAYTIREAIATYMKKAAPLSA